MKTSRLSLVRHKRLKKGREGRSASSVKTNAGFAVQRKNRVYNDNLTQPQFKEWIGQTVGKEEEDATRHDKWCCMMYPRLQLLKDLLREDGAIFIILACCQVETNYPWPRC